ncbi:MAG: antibiotic biosynthesis monooxygenase [Candidatus Saccharibacteria bacterium]|nr:antibiotic biosynthesis monooxygenase [Microbacteriaceae bacterium]
MMVQNTTETDNPVVILMPVFLAKPECVAEFERAILVLQTASRADEGCIDYTVYADREDHNRFVLYERWTSSEALKSHNEQRHVRDFVAVVSDLLVQPFQVARLRSIG